MNSNEQKIGFEVNGAAQRYLDAYRVANAIIAFGKVIKVLGIFVGGALGLASLSILSNAGAFGAVGLIIAIVFGILVFLMGILVSAQGQILMATLDTAVNSSIFLSARDKAEAMSLQIGQECSERQSLNFKTPIANAANLLVGAWRDEDGVTTFNADGTENSEFDSGCTEHGRWSLAGYVLTVVITERDSKSIESISLQYVVHDISDSTFYLKQLGNDESEWRASRV